jgi:hypothetical protein
MEVHQHTHTPRKKWTHYLWEFLMLFLAVFCGFLAENQREHYVEHQREKKYMKNLVYDLAQDTANYNLSRTLRLEKERQAFQLVSLLYSADRNDHLPDLYYYARQMTRLNTLFFPTDATMDQLRNSGALRLIKKSEIADSIVAYDAAVKGFVETQQSEIETRISFKDAAGNIFDASIFISMVDSAASNADNVIVPPVIVKPLVTDNQQTINHLCTLVQYLYSSSIINRRIALKLKNQAIRLLKLLKEEYHLE